MMGRAGEWNRVYVPLICDTRLQSPEAVSVVEGENGWERRRKMQLGYEAVLSRRAGAWLSSKQHPRLLATGKHVM